jgi:hypothetical protein
MDKYLPLVFSLFYLLGSLAVFAFGPFQYELNNPFRLYSYVITAYLFLAAGYLWGVKRTTLLINRDVRTLVNAKAVNSLVLISCLWSIAFAYPTYTALSGGSQSLVQGILNPGEAYGAKQMLSQEISDANNIPMQIKTLTAVIGILFIPIAICFWNVLKRRNRILVVVSTVATTLPWLAVGTLKGLGDVLIMTLVSYLVRTTRSRKGVLSKAFLVPIVLSICVFLAYMGWCQARRLEYYTGDTKLFDSRYYAYSGIPLLRDYLPEMSTGISSILFYPSHGYAALDGCLMMPFQWTYGVGNSRAACSWLEQYFQIDNLEQENYVFRYEKDVNRPSLMLWSTVFPWFASDLTFSGTLCLMLLIGVGFARCWCLSVWSGSVLAIVTLGQIGILIAFVPCNNQLMQSRAGACTVMALIVLWLAHRFGFAAVTELGRGKLQETLIAPNSSS